MEYGKDRKGARDIEGHIIRKEEKIPDRQTLKSKAYFTKEAQRLL